MVIERFRHLPGAPHSPVLLHAPHGSRVIPPAVRDGIVLTDAELARELDHITDAHTDALAALAAERAAVAPWRFVNGLSRLVVDPERFPDEREEMAAVGMGAVYTRTTRRAPLRGPGVAHGPLVDAYFTPYADAMTAAVEDRLATAGRAVVIDVHSYPSRRLPYELHGDGPRPAVCLGTDAYHTPPRLIDAAREAFGPLGGTGLDSPFAGTYVPLRHYRREPRVTALMIEVRRDVYMREPGGAPHAGLERLADALAGLVDAVSPPAAATPTDSPRGPA